MENMERLAELEGHPLGLRDKCGYFVAGLVDRLLKNEVYHKPVEDAFHRLASGPSRYEGLYPRQIRRYSEKRDSHGRWTYGPYGE